MQLNMITSDIKLIGTRIKEMRIDNSIVDVDMNAKKSFGFNINEPIFQLQEGRRVAQLTIDFEVVVEQAEDEKCSINFTVEGAFVSNCETNKEKFEKLVLINGASAIMGIARGKIEAISSNIFNMGKVTIPFVNIMDYYKNILN